VGLVCLCAGAALGVAGLWVLAAVFHSVALAALAAAASVALAGATAWCVRKALRWNMRLWAGSYLCRRRPRLEADRPLDVCFLFVDHFEPDHGRAPPERQAERVRAWESAYRRAIEGHVDSDGRCPQHTWFVPIFQTAEEVRPLLGWWPGLGWGEIEYHLHHDEKPDIADDELRQRITADIVELQKCGAVSSGRYGFVHGMFALAGGDPVYCRVAGELTILQETGCYADFTFPDMETPSQPSLVNAIFYARTNGYPKPHDGGEESAVGTRREGLLMVPGPMGVGLFPKMIDDAQLEPNYPPHPNRIGRWLEAHVHVRGRPNWVFIAVHSHSAIERGREAVFSGRMQRVWAELENRFKGPRCRLHYVTAREVYNIIKAAEAGLDGNPAEFRGFDIAPPAHRNRTPAGTGRKRSEGAPA
jgi:hypothetical protein